MAFRKNKKLNNDFSRVTISLASPESILDSSHGEVTQPETINYRTYKPEMGGLFCERIFGPVKDWECHCGKYKRIRYKGIICDRCGVEVTEKKVRRERMGHIELVVPVAHIWYFKSLPNKIGYLLGLPTKKLDQIVYYERYAVVNPGVKAEDGLQYLDFLTEDEYLDIMDKLPKENQMLDDDDPNKFIAKMGAEALEMLLARLDLDDLSYSLRHQAATDTSQQRKAEALKRLKVVEAFRDARTRIENRPEWMIVRMVPVIPPELRPLVPLDGGRFATSDLNDLYRRVIIRNNRLKRLIDIKAPEVILRNEKRMLQEAVDSLFDNSRKVNAVRSDGNRALKSLSDMLKGKQGRFRQNLLGKRVDYSGRSVIVVGPNLKLHQCGLPKIMALELFKPFVMKRLVELDLAQNIKAAKRMVERQRPQVWDVLSEVIQEHPVLLNRAPTLHRLGIQAFEPVLVEGKAIQIHPLVCEAFNADFDGDQMAVHLPLSAEAQAEARILMLSTNNVLSPASGRPIVTPSQDMVIGIYYLSELVEDAMGAGKTYAHMDEAMMAYEIGELSLHAPIKIRLGEKAGSPEVFQHLDPALRKLIGDEPVSGEEMIETTLGRLLLNDAFPADFPYINDTVIKSDIRALIENIIELYPRSAVAETLDNIKDLGFRYATRAGLTIALDDVRTPEDKADILSEYEERARRIQDLYSKGVVTDDERRQELIEIWNEATEH